MGLLVFLLILTIVIGVRYRPRREKAKGDLFIWYNIHRYTKARDYINVSELWRKIF